MKKTVSKEKKQLIFNLYFNSNDNNISTIADIVCLSYYLVDSVVDEFIKERGRLSDGFYTYHSKLNKMKTI